MDEATAQVRCSLIGPIQPLPVMRSESSDYLAIPHSAPLIKCLHTRTLAFPRSIGARHCARQRLVFLCVLASLRAPSGSDLENRDQSVPGTVRGCVLAFPPRDRCLAPIEPDENRRAQESREARSALARRMHVTTAPSPKRTGAQGVVARPMAMSDHATPIHR